MAHFILYILVLMAPFQQHRKLVVSASSIQDNNYRQQMDILSQDDAGLKERDIMVTTIVRDTIAGFSVELIGKDGGKKYHEKVPVTLPILYGIIDAMPMRKREMRDKRKKP